MYQSTTTSERLQKKNSEQTASTKLTSSQAVSPVKMCHAPALEKALRTAMGKLLAADCGESTQGSLANLGQDGLWQKMSEGCCQQVLISDREETLELFSGTWPTWGIMRSGRVMVLKPLAHRTKGKEPLLWPTAVASDGAQGAVIGKDDTFYTTSTGMPRKVNRNGTDGSVGLGRLVQMWPTPRANKVSGPSGKGFGLNLMEAVDKVHNWPTPTVADTFTGNLKSTQQKPGSMRSVNLSQCVNWPTPRSREGNAGEIGSKGAKHNAARGFLDGVVLQLERSKNENTKYKANTGKVLPMLWEEIREKKVQRKVRRFKRFQPENVLRYEVYGVGTSKGDTEQVGHQQAVNQEKETELRNVWNDRKPTNAPYRRQSVQQQGRQSNDTMHTLSHKMALGTRQRDETEISGLCRVRCGKPCESHVSKALAKIQEVRRSDDDKNKDGQSLGINQRGNLSACWVEILMGLPIGWTDIDCEEPQPWPGWPAPMNAGMRRTPMAGNPTKNGRNEPNLPEQAKITESGQYTYEPPRVVVGQKNWAKRLKALGNGCCPAQIYPIFKVIMEIEKEVSK